MLIGIEWKKNLTIITLELSGKTRQLKIEGIKSYKECLKIARDEKRKHKD